MPNIQGVTDNKWRRIIGKRISRRTKHANRIRNELASLALLQWIDVVFECRIVERENRDNHFLITILDNSMQSGTPYSSNLLFQIIVWERQEYSQPIALYQEKYDSWLAYREHLKPISCCIDSDAEIGKFIRDVRAMVEKHVAERKKI